MAAKLEKIFHGRSVSAGIVFGQALKLDSHNRVILKIHVEDVDTEIRRLQQAIETSKEQLEVLKSRLEEKVGREHSFILDAHILMLEDNTLIAEILADMRNHSASAEWAVTQATGRLLHAYESLEDEYFRQRYSDIENVVERVLLNLSGNRPFSWEQLPEDLIIVSRDFNPSTFATMDIKKVRGLALESGGWASHTAIISRALRLPAVMGINDFLSSVTSGDSILLNGDDGQVILNPAPERIESVRRRIEAFGTTGEPIPPQSGTSSLTFDGTPISLRANTGLPNEAKTAKKCGADGIGLFRSEFLFFKHPHGFPGMEEQLNAYRKMVREMYPHPVAIRTLDAGSEQIGNDAESAGYSNPSMGLRGIRLSLHTKEAFCTQIEAILRAGSEGKIEIVLPMVSTLEEVWQARALIEQVRTSISASSGVALKEAPLGVMIEVPAAVLALETLAKEVDFLCVGTNDLIQYMLAVDRGNPQVAYLFQPLHPSVLQCLHQIGEIGKKLNKPVRICGEISSNPFFTILLLGMGFTQLSMNPLSIPIIRRVLRDISIEASLQITEQALKLVTAHDVGKFLTEAVSKLVKMDLTTYVKEIFTSNE
jgi:phosphotransferase system enzyme I (PtsI)